MNVDAAGRLRGALLAGAGVAALVLGGWWWQAEAPSPARPGALAGVGVSPDGFPLPASYRPENRATGAMVRDDPDAASSYLVVDPRTGAVVGRGETGTAGVAPDAAATGRWPRDGEVVWTERALLDAGAAVVRQTRISHDERHLLWFSCTGPGELLVVVAGARAADPMTVGCDGAMATTEVIGTGAAMRVSFSPAGADPVEVEARLIVLR
ncbi:hypothetical protein KIF24_01575 [Micromonospora sp. Llam7]|uniref:hypothetical protein n=1 Tax=Micromonospora tarapacensis TaxID=2835305 RepID=UPI001C82AE4C|nr:hypothetical protein [Micromonospora tarapacensis]MBX7264873.1 hypothetical protein [Micromonospora tarapacensis]